MRITVVTTLLLSFLMIFSGCSQKSTEYGAAGAASGAIGASMVGALTDLIVDGEIDPYRLQRNMVSGAIVGGAAGAVAGHQVDKQAEKAAAKPEPASSSEDEDLKNMIGATNYQALGQLISCQHDEAFRLTLESARSSDLDHELAAYAIEALIDTDRGNEEGKVRALEAFIAKDDKIRSLEVAERELKKLYERLQDERRIRGKSMTCTNR